MILNYTVKPIIEQVFSFKFLLVIISIFLILSLEILFLGWEKSSFKRLFFNPSKSAKLDILVSLLYGFRIVPIITIICSLGLGDLIPLVVKKYFGYDLFHSIKNPLLQNIAYMLLYDFVFYWKHRFSHELKWWWELHKFHHSATEFNIITANRLHPLDEAVKDIFMCVPLTLVGAPPESYVYIAIFRQIQQFFGHSMLPWNFGWIGKYLIVSPITHRIHHSTIPEHVDKNYGNLTPIWDRIFGTWYEGDVLNMSISVQNNLHNKNPWYQDIWQSYVLCLKEILNSFKSCQKKIIHRFAK